MDTTLHPAHILLGVKPEPLAKARAKVICCLIALGISTALILTQDLDLIRAKIKNQTTHIKAKLRRGRRNSKFEIL